MALTLDRRGLLKLLGCGGCALTLPSLSGCTIAEVFGGGSATVAFNLNEAAYAGLKSVGGVASVDAAGRNLLLIRTDASTVMAVSRICTHTACDMAPDRFGTFDGQKLICRCHNSHFAPTGEVLQGPATKDLASYPVSFDPATGTGEVRIGDEAEPDAAPAADGGPGADAGPDLLCEPEPECANLVMPEAIRDDPGAVEAGRALYELQACSGCHGDQGQGTDFPSMPPPTRFNTSQFGTTDGYLFWRIRTGQATGPAGSVMIAYKDPPLSDDEVWRIVRYLRSLAK